MLKLSITTIAFLIALLFYIRKRKQSKKYKYIVIVGASSGIGRQLALDYAKRNCHLILVARRKELLEAVQKECLDVCIEKNQQIHIFCGDATNEDTVNELAQFTRHTLGSCDVLIISMGALSTLPFEQVIKDQPLQGLMTDLFSINVYGPMLLSKTFFPLLKESKGRIVPISSIAGVFPAPTRSLYVSCKHALNGFFDSLRIEWSIYGISVILIMPGSVLTDLRSKSLDGNQTLNGQTNVLKGISAEECSKKIINGIDLNQKHVFIPAFYGWVWLLKGFVLDWIDEGAKRKYSYPS